MRRNFLTFRCQLNSSENQLRNQPAPVTCVSTSFTCTVFHSFLCPLDPALFTWWGWPAQPRPSGLSALIIWARLHRWGHWLLSWATVLRPHRYLRTGPTDVPPDWIFGGREWLGNHVFQILGQKREHLNKWLNFCPRAKYPLFSFPQS